MEWSDWSRRLVAPAPRATLVACAASLLLAGCPPSACPDDASAAPDSAATRDDAAMVPDVTEADADASAAPPDAPPDAPSPRYGGLISIQDMSLAGLPQAGHGLTVVVDVGLEARAPDYDEQPGQPTGCKAWLYTVPGDVPPPRADEGALTIAGLRAVDPLTCNFVAGSGYVCPVAAGEDDATVGDVGSGRATYTWARAAFTARHAGLYARIAGATGAANNGTFPILAAPSAQALVLGNAGASAEAFTGRYTVLAGLGPVPGNPNDPIGDGDRVTVSLATTGHFSFGTAPVVTAGGAFDADTGTIATMSTMPLDGRAVTLSCTGAGGRCGTADATLVLISTTDGDTTGLPPTAMPPPVRSHAVIRCASLGTGSITVPAAAMDLLRRTHAASPVRRIRAAFMRDGVAFGTSPTPGAANPVAIGVGHGALGFTQVGAAR